MSVTYIPMAMRLDAMLARMETRETFEGGLRRIKAVLPCGICKEPIEPGQRIAFDHTHAEGLGGKTTYKDIRPVHAERDGEFACHKRKTSGTKATAAGSDVHMIAKTRPGHADKFKVNKPPLGEPRDPSRRSSAWRSRPFNRPEKRDGR